MKKKKPSSKKVNSPQQHYLTGKLQHLGPKEIQKIFDLALSLDEPAVAAKPKSADEGNASSYQEGGDHYKRMKIQPWDVVDTWPLQQRIGAYRFSVLKYIMRLGEKDNLLVEAKKSKHCCHKLQDTIEIGETTGE